jgi:hypothetical protein
MGLLKAFWGQEFNEFKDEFLNTLASPNHRSLCKVLCYTCCPHDTSNTLRGQKIQRPRLGILVAGKSQHEQHRPGAVAVDPDRIGPSHGPSGGVADSFDEAETAFRAVGSVRYRCSMRLILPCLPPGSPCPTSLSLRR